MASRQGTVDYILEQIAGAGAVTARKMFGEYGLFLDGKMVAFGCDDQLYVKPTTAGRAHIGELIEAPPYQGAKPSFLIDGDRWEDAEWLSRLITSTAAELPAPKQKKKRARR